MFDLLLLIGLGFVAAINVFVYIKLDTLIALVKSRGSTDSSTDLKGSKNFEFVAEVNASQLYASQETAEKSFTQKKRA